MVVKIDKWSVVNVELWGNGGGTSVQSVTARVVATLL